MITTQEKLNADDIKTISHTLLIPIILTIITSNILYAITYLAFINFIYTKIKTNTILSQKMKFISALLLETLLIPTTLILIAINADFLINIIK